jgi:hypothetical protein
MKDKTIRWLAIWGMGAVLVLVMGVLGAQHHTSISPAEMSHVSPVPTTSP